LKTESTIKITPKDINSLCEKGYFKVNINKKTKEVRGPLSKDCEVYKVTRKYCDNHTVINNGLYCDMAELISEQIPEV